MMLVVNGAEQLLDNHTQRLFLLHVGVGAQKPVVAHFVLSGGRGAHQRIAEGGQEHDPDAAVFDAVVGDDVPRVAQEVGHDLHAVQQSVGGD